MVKGEKIENIIEEIKSLYPDCSYSSFLERFRTILHLKKEFKKYNFIVGSKNENGYFCKGYVVDVDDVKWDGGYAEAGTSETILKNRTKIDLCNFGFPYNTSLDDVEAVLKTIVKDTIDIGDKILRYNPVGGSIDVLRFR